MEVNGANSVIEAINNQGGVYMCGRYVPIWLVVLVEFVLAYTLEILMGSPCSFKLASNVFNPRETHPVLFETAIICATVGLMCPAMSFIAAFLYYPYYAGFDVFTLLANWVKLVCLTFLLRSSASCSLFNLLSAEHSNYYSYVISKTEKNPLLLQHNKYGGVKIRHLLVCINRITR